MSVAGGLQGLHFINTMNNAGIKKSAAEAESIIAGMGRNIGKLAPFAPLAAGSLILGKLADDAYDFSREFEMSMKEIETISQATKNNIKGVSDEIINMSANGADSANELAKGFYQIVSAGYDWDQKGREILEISSKLSTGARTSVFTAADTLTSILNAYGDKAGDVTSISDKLFEVVKNGKTTMGEFGSSIVNVTGLAAQAGVKLDDLFAAYATGTKTLKTDEFTTGLRGFLTSIIKPSDEAINMAKQLGIEFNSEALAAKGLSSFLQELMEKTQGNVDVMATLFPNVRGLNGVFAIGAENGAKFAEQVKNIGESFGNTESSAKTMMEAVDNKWKQVYNKWKRELKDLGESLKLTSGGLADLFNSLLTDQYADIINPQSQSAIQKIVSQISSADGNEEKLRVITEEMIRLRNEAGKLHEEAAKWEKVQPFWLQRKAENVNAALGFGPATMPGRYNQAQLGIVQKDIEVNKLVQEKLKELYQEALKSSNQSLTNINTPSQSTKIWRVADSQAEIDKLKEKLGTVSIEQEVELRFKIADEQNKIDEFYTKVRQTLEEAINESWDTPFSRSVGADGTNSKIETTAKGGLDVISQQAEKYREQTRELAKQLAPMRQLTEEQERQLRAEESKIEAQLEQIENIEELAKALYGSSQLLGAVRYAVGEVNSDAGEALGRLSDIARNAGSMVANWSSDPVTAISSGIGVIGNIIGLFSKDMKSAIDVLNESLELTNDNLKLLATLNDTLSGSDWAIVAQSRIKVLNKNIEDTLSLMNEIDVYRVNFQTGEREKVDTSSWDASDWIREYTTTGLISMSTEELRLYIEQLGNYKNELDGLTESTQNNALGFNADDIASTIFSGIEDGLKLSENGLGDWSDNFGDLIRKALMQNIATALNAEFIENFMRDFNTYMSDGLLDSNERKDLEERFIEGVKKGEDYLAVMESIVGQYQTGADAGDGYSELKGITRSLTEETGSELVGQLMAQRMHLSGIDNSMTDWLGIAEDSLEVLRGIEQNTSYNQNLDGMHEELKTMNATLKEGLGV